MLAVVEGTKWKHSHRSRDSVRRTAFGNHCAMLLSTTSSETRRLCQGHIQSTRMTRRVRNSDQQRRYILTAERVHGSWCRIRWRMSCIGREKYISHRHIRARRAADDHSYQSRDEDQVTSIHSARRLCSHRTDLRPMHTNDPHPTSHPSRNRVRSAQKRTDILQTGEGKSDNTTQASSA